MHEKRGQFLHFPIENRRKRGGKPDLAPTVIAAGVFASVANLEDVRIPMTMPESTKMPLMFSSCRNSRSSPKKSVIRIQSCATVLRRSQIPGCSTPLASVSQISLILTFCFVNGFSQTASGLGLQPQATCQPAGGSAIQITSNGRIAWAEGLNPSTVSPKSSLG